MLVILENKNSIYYILCREATLLYGSHKYVINLNRRRENKYKQAHSSTRMRLFVFIHQFA